MSRLIEKNHFEPQVGVNVVFQGSKPIWKIRTHLDVIIALHISNYIFEVITFNPDVGKEAPRLYIDGNKLLSEIDPDEIQKLLHDKKEDSIRHKISVNVSNLTKEVTQQCLIKYIFHRLHLIYQDENDKTNFSVVLNHLSNDQEQYKFIVQPPASLRPLVTHFLGKINNSVDIEHAIEDLRTESIELKKATKVAELVTSGVDGFRAVLAARVKEKEELDYHKKIKLRWKNATHKIIYRKFLEKVRQRLLELERKKNPVILKPEVGSLQKSLSDSIDRTEIIHKERALLNHKALNSYHSTAGTHLSPLGNTNQSPTNSVRSINTRNNSVRSVSSHKPSQKGTLPHLPTAELKKEKSVNSIHLKSLREADDEIAFIANKSASGNKMREVPSILSSFTSVAKKFDPRNLMKSN